MHVVLRRGLQWGLDTVFLVALALVVLLAFLGFAVLAFLLGAHGTWLVYVPLGVWIATLFAGELYVVIWFPYRRGGTTPAMRLRPARVDQDRANEFRPSASAESTRFTSVGVQ